MTRNNPLIFMALPAIIGGSLVLAGAKAASVPSRGVSGLGTEAEDILRENITATQQYQSQALSGSIIAMGLLATPVLALLGVLWFLRKDLKAQVA